MKYEQIDIALSFLGEGDHIIVQYEHERDRKLLVRYIQDKLEHDIIYTKSSDRYMLCRHGRVSLVNVLNDHTNGMHGIPFFIERKSDNYREGDEIGVSIAEYDPISNSVSTIRRSSSTYATIARKHGVKPSISVEQIYEPPVENRDNDTLLIQYDSTRISLVDIRNTIHSIHRKQAESYVDIYRMMDIFVNINNIPGSKWKRIVYEDVHLNTHIGKKFNDGYIIVIGDETFNNDSITIDKIMKGGVNIGTIEHSR